MYFLIDKMESINLFRTNEEWMRLLSEPYRDEISTLICNNNKISIIVNNKPNQRIYLKFVISDRLNIIKNKLDKLIKSDGICVICCEPEIYDGSRICDTCCEFVCNACCMKIEGCKCPVCRTCIWTYDCGNDICIGCDV